MEYLKDNDTKKELIKMFTALINYFETNNIKYSIMSGTMLGAIRHKGFIPWDDDIDVAVLRKDYNRLVGILNKNKHIDDTYYFEGVELGFGSRPFLKLFNNRIRVETESEEDNHLWIDVFPIDGIPNKFSKLYMFYIKKILRNAINVSDRELFKEIIANHNFIYNSYYLLLKMIFFNKSTYEILKIYIKESSKFDIDNCTFVQDVTWGTKKFPKYLFDDLVDYQFENITVKGFKDYDTYLTCIYGDYMKLPPEDQRVNHGIKAWRITDNEE